MEGDSLIKEFAQILEDSFHEDDAIARIGGDEFMIVIEANNVVDIPQCLAKLDKLTEETSKGRIFPIHSSYGVGYSLDDHEPDPAELMKIADKRMYENKSNYYKHNGLDRRH